ncbi:MAG: polysaccharide pyruvyl transferase family protein [Bacteroidaceae bacterium]|nr:polysaccharide pyruvyl transferase family protein [Bacteroidaceae bacterium]
MKIGIITMHKVLNYGSALQAYALQRKLFLMGYDNELIDYLFPPANKKKITISAIIQTIIIFLRNAVVGFPTARKKKRFEAFYQNNFILSAASYNEQNIKDNPPIYDAYITGSDQVWNPRFAGTDSNFFLGFAPTDKPKFSYASSFATTKIDSEQAPLYSRLLSEYDEISVRESTGISIVKELTGKDATVCCDPTLLLTADEWRELSDQSVFKLKEKFILVYILNYMIGNVSNEVQKQIDYVQQTLGYKVVYLVGRKEDAFRPNSILYKAGGPAEFVWLFRNAEFVITTSFHGVAFSLIHGKPLLGIVDKSNKDDSRLQSLLVAAGVEQSCLDYRDVINWDKAYLLSLRGKIDKLDEMRLQSVRYIERILSKL